MPASRLAIAAGLVIGLFLVFRGGQKTLYAQFISAIEEAKTYHIVLREYHSGQLSSERQIWYDRGTGIAEKEQCSDRAFVRIDNGTFEWRYEEGGSVVSRQNSFRPKDEYGPALCREWLQHQPNRDPSGDRLIQGTPCQMYTASDKEMHGSIWADSEKRIREMIASKNDPNDRMSVQASIEYDMPIEARIFTPLSESDPNIKTVNPRQLVEQTFPLDGALWKKDTLGLTLAVHTVQYGEPGVLYMVCSRRLTEETRRRLDVRDPWQYYGNLDLRNQPLANDPYSYSRPELLARMRHDGVQVDWYLIVPPRGDPNKCQVDVWVDTANELEKLRQADGLATRERFTLDVPPAQPGGRVSIQQVTSQIYSMARQFDAIVHSFLVTTRTTAGNKMRLNWKKPFTELSREEFAGDIKQRIQQDLGR